MQLSKSVKKERRELFKEVVQAFEKKYSWLGHQAARELLLSAASWNIEKYSDPPFRYRTHVMLAWEKGWFKSTILRKMSGILGDSMVSKTGKVTDAAIRGSSSGGQFTPPKVLESPILVTSEFGQTDFQEELLNVFLALLEEGESNVTMNKIGSISETQRNSIQDRFDDQIDFQAENGYNIKTDFVFWGGTYDPVKLEDDALRSRFNIVTPDKQLDWRVTKAADNNRFNVSADTVKKIRQELRRQEEVEVDFRPPDALYKKYNLEPRESAPLQSYMACRNWWGLPVNPDIMEEFVKNLKQSRKIAKMAPEDRVFDQIFENAMTYEELIKETGYDRQRLYKLLNNIAGAERIPSAMSSDGKLKWVVQTGNDNGISEYAASQ